jgi:hypothetical protein
VIRLGDCTRSSGIHRVGEAKDHLIASTWSLRGLRGSDTLARVLQRGLVESADSPIPREKLGGVFLPLFTFRIYFVYLHS